MRPSDAVDLNVLRPCLVIIGGLPGTGKSTLGSKLAVRTGWALLRSDEIRKEILGAGHTRERHAFGDGIYSEEATARTYDALIERARAFLAQGRSVIADASWLSAQHRSAAALLAEETSSEFVQLRCVLRSDVAAERIRGRNRADNDPSDADPTVARAMEQTCDPWPEAAEVPTEGQPDEVSDSVLRELRRRGLSAAAL